MADSISDDAGSIQRWKSSERGRLAAAITDLQYARVPGLAERFGAMGRVRCEEDAGHHLDYLVSAATQRSPALFLDYIAWAKALLAGLKIGSDDLRTNLECVRDVLDAEAPEPLRGRLLSPLAQALDELDAMPEEVPSAIEPSRPHAGLARRYLDAMLGGRRRESVQMILDAADGGVSVRDLYLDVFTPALREIGRLWQTNAITVADEHYCTAVTQLVIAQLYPRVFSSARRGRTLVATCIAGDLHEVGVRMVADFFEMDGWDTYYLGASVPASSITKMVADKSADVLAISATITRHVDLVGELIAQVRANEATAKVRVLVGGHPFNVDESLWKKVGADAHARDADAAVHQANAFLDSSSS